MLDIIKTRTAGTAALLALSLLASSPVLAETPAKAKSPKVDETIVVTEVTFEPVNLASKILDSDAYTTDGTKIGDVSDLVLDETNKVTAVVVGVGGFLGIDETYVAIPVSKISYKYDSNKMKVIAAVTKDELKAAKKAQ